jgi:exopolysaccharide biosynthesis polyprenyl glycosylphosphotransferase
LYRLFFKRLLDVALSLAGLIMLSPLMIVAAIAVRLTSEGPVLYLQPRAGLGGRPFRMAKFRTMVVNAERMGAGYGMEKDDPRITKVGKFLRATSLDELPQLWNVLRGDMSIVGPRPGLLYQAAAYSEKQARRLAVRPGVTGWAQIHGRNEIPWSRRIELDLWYVDHVSFATDLHILLRTVTVVVLRSGVRQDQLASDVEDFDSTASGCPSGGTSEADLSTMYGQGTVRR